jgi:hypothetical protein
VGGSKTDKLLAPGVTVPGLECRGRLPQEELDRLLVAAQAVLVPQFRGFGALTRLPEMACAGIPTLTSRHPTFALDVPPGVHIVEDGWEAWCAAMASFVWSDPSAVPNGEPYEGWEQAQSRTLTTLLDAYCPRT